MVKMTITMRKLNQETFNKAEKYLQQVSEIEGENLYGHFLVVQEGMDSERMLDALIYMEGNKINILSIWIFEMNPKTERLSPRNKGGERGRHAKLLGERYLNRFLEHLATVDIDNLEERLMMITADLIKEVEAEIDQGIDPERITEADEGEGGIRLPAISQCS
jgi:hypothetical protein